MCNTSLFSLLSSEVGSHEQSSMLDAACLYYLIQR